MDVSLSSFSGELTLTNQVCCFQILGVALSKDSLNVQAITCYLSEQNLHISTHNIL